MIKQIATWVKRIPIEKRRKLEGVVFVSPFILGCLLFFVFPIVMSIRLSFSDIVQFAGFKMEWLGPDHYVRAFVWDLQFVPIFLDVVQFTLTSVPLIIVFSLLIAMLINRPMKLKGFFRMVFFLPFLLGTGYVMQQLVGQNIDEEAMNVARGIILPDDVLHYLGPRVTRVVEGFLSSITIILWKSGVQILLFLSALQGISPSLFESARCDGASEWEMFWKITLPMITSVLLLNIVYTLINSFTDIDNALVTYIIEQAFQQTDFEYAAAMGWIYFVFVFLLVGLVFLVMRRRVYRSKEY